MMEILSNFFRSVILLSPNDLLSSVYLCLNQLAPAYELGIAEHTLMKAIAQSTGRSLAQIKTDAQNTGDLGLVAEQSKSGQRMMFRPAPHSIEGVFGKLKEIAKMTGTASMAKKVDKIQSMFVACRHAEARFIIRSLAGKLRIGLVEQSLLQALAQACAMTLRNPSTHQQRAEQVQRSVGQGQGGRNYSNSEDRLLPLSELQSDRSGHAGAWHRPFVGKVSDDAGHSFKAYAGPSYQGSPGSAGTVRWNRFHLRVEVRRRTGSDSSTGGWKCQHLQSESGEQHQQVSGYQRSAG